VSYDRLTFWAALAALFLGMAVGLRAGCQEGRADSRNDACVWHCGGTEIAEWTGEACYCADVVEVTP